MTITTPSDQTSRGRIAWIAILQLIFSAVASFLLFAVAGIFILTGLSTYFTHGHNPSDLTEPFMVAGSLIFAGSLVLPSAWFAWKHISNPGVVPTSRPEPRLYGLVMTILVFIVTGLALLAGNWAAQNERIAWLILPPLNIIVTGLPAFWLIYFGTRGLLPNSPRHKWGVFAGGLVLGPAIILVAELTLLLIVAILAVTWIMQANPTLADQLPGLLSRLRSNGTDTQEILNVVLPYILNPGVIFLGFSFISALVPIIEETLKPIGVWFMSGNRITPAMGFGFGVLSGAGFGLFENLGNTSGAGADWALLAGSRISTLLLHSFTAGLVGWGLASAWSQRRFLRLAICFMTAVLIHGLWNGMAVLSSAASLPGETSLTLPPLLQPLGALAAFGIFGLGALVAIAFFGFNAYLRRSVSLSTLPDQGDTGNYYSVVPPQTPQVPAELPPASPAETSPGGPQAGQDPSQIGIDPHLPESDAPSKTNSEFYP